MNKKKFIIILGACVLALAGISLLLLRKDVALQDHSSSETITKAKKKDFKNLRTNKKNLRKRASSDKSKITKLSPIKRRNKSPLRAHVIEEAPLTTQEQKLYDDIQNAIDSEKVSDVIKLCQKITSSSKRELREHAVNALGWFDEKTMAELTLFIADPDEDIASDALFQWQEALNEIESEVQRADIISKVMNILQDENALEQLSMELNSLDEKIAVETLVGIISGDNPAGIKVGKEAYEFITGEKYTNPEGANNWIKENYTPPQ